MPPFISPLPRAAARNSNTITTSIFLTTRARPLTGVYNKNNTTMFAQILATQDMKQRPYTDNAGAQRIFKSKGFVLKTDIGTLYVEAIQEIAESLEAMNLQKGDCGFVTLTANARQYQTANKEERYTTEFLLKGFVTI